VLVATTVSFLALALCPPISGQAYVAPRAVSASRRGGRLGRQVTSPMRAAASASSASPEPAIVGAWRYAGGAYEIRQTGGKLFFHEHVSGELRPEGDWLVAELPTAGTIRLKLSEAGSEVLSNFKQIGTSEWGDTIAAVKEWEALTSKTKELNAKLETLRFEGTVADGGVAVTVDGHQRPVDLRISPEVAAAKDLGSLIAEAQSSAAKASHEATTESLRELYASHFGQTSPTTEV